MMTDSVVADPTDLLQFQKFMNPRGLDIGNYSPSLHPAVDSNPKRSTVTMAIPDIPPDAIVVGRGTQIFGNVTVGKGTAIFEDAYIRADKGETIEIGEGCDIQDRVKMHVSPTRQSNVKIGNYVTLAHDAICHGAIVKDYAFVALNAILNDGCVVGEGTFVDSGTVVNAGAILKDRRQYHGDVPLGYVLSGPTARVLRQLKEKFHTIEKFEKMLSPYEAKLEAIEDAVPVKRLESQAKEPNSPRK